MLASALGVALVGPGRALAAGTGSAATSQTITLTDDQDVYEIGPSAEVLVDETGELTLEDVRAPGAQGDFTPVSEIGSLAGQHAIWVRLRITNQADQRTRWMLLYDDYRLNSITAFMPEGTGYHIVETGNTRPFSSRDVTYRAYAFRLDPPSIGAETVYIRLNDLSGLTSLDPMTIETQEVFNNEVQRSYLWAGIYYSIVLTVLFWGVLFIFSIRERAVPAFAAFLLSAVVLSLSADGLGQQFLWPDATVWSTYSMIVSVTLFVAALLNVTVVSLDVETHLPRWARAAKVLVVVLVVFAFLRFIPGEVATPVTIMLMLCLFAGFTLPLAIGVRMIPKSRLPALTFLLGFTAYLALSLVGIVVTTLNSSLNIEPWSRAAFIWLLLVFSAVIQQRINAVRRDKEQAQEKLIAEQEDALRIQRELTGMMQDSRDKMVTAYDTTLEGWARLLETRDKETEGHCRNVASLTVRFAEAMGMEPDDVVAVRRGALLHDIGKISIPDSVLLKPGALTPEERAVMEQHPVFAQQALAGIPFLARALDIPVYHHERWDGTGYPYGLKGEDIPLSARMFAIVDNWDALLSDRPYRNAWPIEDVIKHLEDNAGVLFDPEIVPVFLAVVGRDAPVCVETDAPDA